MIHNAKAIAAPSIAGWMTAILALMLSQAFAQSIPLQKIEDLIIQGKREGLQQLAPYLDSKAKVIEHLGHHILTRTEAEIAERIISENSLFEFPEAEYGKSLSKTEFLDFLKTKPVQWCDTLEAFVAAPWRNTNVKYRPRGLTQDQIAARSKLIQSMEPEWMFLKHWDELLRQGDPRLMPEIAAECYRNRYRFDRYHDIEPLIQLIEACTHLQIAFQKSDGEYSYDLDEFDEIGLLNLLNFWLTNYPAFRWDPQQGCFVSPQFPSPNPLQEVDWFTALESKDDTMAYAAFIALAQGDPEVVTALAKEHALKYSLNTNRTLGTFPYRSLQQLPWMVQYCRDHQIDYQGSPKIQPWFAPLEACNNAKSVRAIEKKMLIDLQLADATALEYWAITHAHEYWGHVVVTHVLDQLYSQHWQAILADPPQLELYLRKANWFQGLGIIGACRSYLNKFISMPKEAITYLNAIPNPDHQLQAVIDSAIVRVKGVPHAPQFYKGKNVPHEVHNLGQAFDAAIQKHEQDKQKYFFEARQLISEIHYAQIAEALLLVEQDTFIQYTFPGDRYDFINSDFGIPVDSLLDPQHRQDFLQRFATMSEYELYRYYLRKSGLDFENAKGELDLVKIYGILEFGLAEAFMGGSVPPNNREVYSLVKLLEIKFGTRLGFPEKLCFYGSYTVCSAREWAQAWMQYMEEKGIVKRDPWQPRSLGYEY